MELFQPFIQNEIQHELLQISAQLAEKIKLRVKESDEKATFLNENLQDLKDANYVTLTLPEQFGGKSISLYEMLLLQEKLATGDGSVALSIGWHLGVVKELWEAKL
jgi:alkylation response protein AidB-like acyl-CoA dehydrogenase